MGIPHCGFSRVENPSGNGLVRGRRGQQLEFALEFDNVLQPRVRDLAAITTLPKSGKFRSTALQLDSENPLLI